MSKNITITSEDIFQQIKLSFMISDIVQQTVSRKLIIADAEESGINVEPDELQKAADLFRGLYKLASADDTWKWLKKHGLSIDDFQEIIYNGIIIDKLKKRLFSDKVDAFFFENSLDYLGVIMYQVILDNQDLALELFYAINEGEISFYDVAHKYIHNVELRRKGGYLGLLHRRDLRPEISAAVFAAKPPQLIKPIKTSQGIHLILVEEIIQPELNEKMRQQILNDLGLTWIKEKSNQVTVDLRFA